MTVERAREIFGSKLETYTDNEVEEFIYNFNVICDSMLDILFNEITTNSSENDTINVRN